MVAAKPNTHTMTVAVRRLRWSVVLVGLAAAVLASPRPVAAAPCGVTRACQCGDTLTTNYTMTADLSCNARGIYDNGQNRAAIVLDSNNINLDCNGYAIILNPDPTGGGVPLAPDPDNKPYALRNGKPNDCDAGGFSGGCRSNVTVKNCRFRGYQSGVYAPKATSWTIQDNRFEGRFRQDYVGTGDPATEYAIRIGPSDGNGLTIQRNVFWSPYGGIYASFNAAGGRDVVIRDNDILDAFYVGMELRSLHERSEVANNRITVNTPNPAQAKRAALWLASPEGVATPRIPVKVYGNYLDCADAGYAGTNGASGNLGTCDYGDLAITTTAAAVDVYDNVLTGSGWDSADSISPAGVDWCPGTQKKNVFTDELATKNRVPTGTCSSGGGIRKPCKSLADYCGAVGCTIGATVSITENTCLKDEAYQFTNGFTAPAFAITADNVALDCGHGGSGSINPPTLATDQMAKGIVVDGRQRVTVNDCNVYNTREGFRLGNSTGVLLRENVVLNTKQFTAIPKAVGQQYFYHVVSDPPGDTEPDVDPKHFDQFLYNPFLNHDPDANYTLNWVGGSGNVGAKKLIYYAAGGSVISTAAPTTPTGWKDFTAAAFGPGVCTSCFVLTGRKGQANPNDLLQQFGAVGHLTVANSTNVVIQAMDVNWGLPTQAESAGDGIGLLGGSGATLTSNRVQNAAVGFFVLGSPNVTITDGAADDTQDTRLGIPDAGNSFGLYARWSQNLTVTGAPATSNYNYNHRPFLDESGKWAGEVGIEIRGFTDPSIADAVTISNSTVQGNQRGGILLYDVDQSNLWGNALVNNGDDDDDVTVAAPQQCSDGIDNDGDGKTDFTGGDLECASDADANEAGGPSVLLQRSSNNKVYQNTFSGVAYGHALQIVPALTPGGVYDLDPANPTQQSRYNWVYLNTLYQTFRGDSFHQVGGPNFYGWKWKGAGDTRCTVYPNTPCASDLSAWPDPAAYPPSTTVNNSIIPVGSSSGDVVGLRIRFSQGDRVYNNDIGRIDRSANGLGDEYPFGDGGIRLDGDSQIQTFDTWLSDNRVQDNHHHQIYLTWADGVTMDANTVVVRNPIDGPSSLNLWDGIRVANSVGGTIQNNTVLTGEGRYGINIVNSNGFKLKSNTIQDPSSGGDHWPHLNVGTNFVEYAYDPYGYPDGSGYYDHGIYQSNQAGREGSLKPIVYVSNNSVYPANNSAPVLVAVAERQLGPGYPAPRLVNNPSHLQIAASQGWQVIGPVSLTDADPVQLYRFTYAAGQLAVVNTLNTGNCRSACKPGTSQPCEDACLVVANSSGQPKADPGSCPVGGSCCDQTNTFSNLTVTSGDGHGVYVAGSQCNTFSNVSLASFNSGGRSGVYGLALANSSYNTVTHATALNTFDANRTNVQDIWELKLWGNSDRNDFQRNKFNDQGAWETQCQTAKDGCCNATTGNGCDVDCGEYWDGTSFVAVDVDCTPTNAANDGCRAQVDSIVDPDCPIGVDPDANPTARTDKDGFCRVISNDNTCDPDCTARADDDCKTTSASCDPTRLDGICDPDCQVGNYPPLQHSAAYDCNNDGDTSDTGEAAGATCPSLYAFDPDCDTRDNNWCDAGVAGNLNDFLALPGLSCKRNDESTVSCGYPNYSQSAYGFNSIQYGGGRPLGSLNCTAPQVRFDNTGTFTQRRITRLMTLAERNNMPGRFEGMKAEFGDLDGADLVGGVRWASEVVASTDPYTGAVRQPYHTSGSLYIPPSPPAAGAVSSTFLPGNPAPWINPDGDYQDSLGIGALGDAAKNPIRTTRGSAWSNIVTFNWYANGSFVGTNKRGWYWLDMMVDDDSWLNYSGPEASILGIPDTVLELQQRRRVFVDTKAPELPAGFTLTINEITTSPPGLPPDPAKRYQLSWPLVTGEDTSGTTQSWTNNVAHYEIWYGLNQNEVNARNGTVYVWEDVAASSSNLPHEITGVCPWANIPVGVNDGGNYDCYDSTLGSINCFDGSCGTVLSTNIGGSLYYNICAVDDFGNESCFSTGAVSGIQTQYGDVYSARDLISQELATYANATYQLSAGGSITKWTSSGGAAQPYVNLTYPVLPFPSKANNYTTAYGSLPYLVDLNSDATFGTVTTKLQAMYGSARVKSVSSLGVAANALENPLGGKIYVCDGSCLTSGTATVGSVLSLRNGNHGGADLDGSGLIIVNGNLRVSADVTYAASPGATPVAAKLKHLASLTWLVLGDVAVDGNVQNLAGTFLVLGRPDAPLAASALPTDLTTLNRFGVFDSCYAGSCSANTLTVRGLVVARYFNLRRTKPDLSTGSEIVIYDGRVLANTPPGLEDAIKSLPKWGEGN